VEQESDHSTISVKRFKARILRRHCMAIVPDSCYSSPDTWYGTLLAAMVVISWGGRLEGPAVFEVGVALELRSDLGGDSEFASKRGVGFTALTG